MINIIILLKHDADYFKHIMLCSFILRNLFIDLTIIFIFQNLEVVPLFGDMQIAPFNYIKRSAHFDASKWPLSSSPAISPQAELMIHLPQIREDHGKYISELARYSNEVCSYFIKSFDY